MDEAGDRAATQDAHATYFEMRAQRAFRSIATASDVTDAEFQWVEAERTNIRVALARLVEIAAADRVLHLATVLAGSWEFHLSPNEGRQWLEWALARTEDHPTVARARALAAIAEMHWVQCQYEQAWRYGEESLALATRLRDKEATALAIHRLGNIALSRHDWKRAKPLLEQSVARWRPLGNRVMEGFALQLLAGVAHGLGDEDGCARHATEALALFRDLGHAAGVTSALARLGRLVRDRGDDRGAALTFAEVLRISEEVGDNFALLQAFAGLGEIASRRGQPEIAAALMGFIDARAEEAGATRLPAAGVNYDRATAAARVTLGEDRFAALRIFGHGLAAEQAMALARMVETPPAADGYVVPSWLPSRAEALAVPRTDDVAFDLLHRGDAPIPGIAKEPPWDLAFDLTYREQDVLALLCQRQTDAEIAARLFISPRTVASHVSNILAKLGAANRREAAAIAARQGLLGS